jgi:Bifunctional DNA primase/polymerase, N-terminal/AAA domain
MHKVDPKLKQLLSYTEKGWALLPIKQNSKLPLTQNGHKDASKEADQIRKWHSRYPNANWAVATGRASGIFVIDIDVKNDKNGLDSWKKLKATFSSLVPTLGAKTPSGGKHYYYAYPKSGTVKSKIEFLAGMDIKGDGGYVLLAPSNIGKPYSWMDLDVSIQNAPELLMRFLTIGAAALPPIHVSEGSRNEQIFKYSLSLKKLGVKIEDATDFVKLAAQLTLPLFPESEALACLKSAYGAHGYGVGGESLKLTSITIEEFLEKELRPREWVAYPLIPKQGLSMIYAKSGVGKTWLAMELSYAVACGTSCFEGKFIINKPAKVLYIDGEMAATSMQDRLKAIAARHGDIKPEAGYFRVVTPDFQESGTPDIASPRGQIAIEEILDDAELLIIDNLSCLCQSGKENEAESWLPIQQWALKLRRHGVAVVFIHHAGKNGSARGTSRRDGVLDSVIVLTRPDDYKQAQGARYSVHYEKSRAIYGNDVEDFEIWLKDDSKTWEVTDQINREDLKSQVIKFHLEGKSLRDIEKLVSCGKTKIGEIIKAWQQTNNQED